MKRKKPEDAGRSPRRAQELLHNARLGADTSPAAGHEPAENEAPFRSLSEQSLVGAYVLRDEHLSYVNPALARMCGYERAELTGAHFSRVIHPDDVALVAENLRRRVNGETGAQRYECRGVRKDGLTVFIEILGAAGAKVDGTLVTFGNILDITERKRAENELRESRALLASAFDKSPLLMSISDLSTGKYREVNESFCAVSGFGREEVIGRTSLELGWVSAEGRARMMDELRRTEKVTGMELGLRRKDGREIFARYWGDVIRSAEGDTLFSAAEDITERRRAEALAKELQSHLAAAVAVAELGSYETLGELGQPSMDDRAIEIFGIPPDHADRGRDYWLGHIHPEDLPRVEAVRKEVLSGKSGQIWVQYRYLHPTRGVRWINHASRAVADLPEGGPRRIVGVVQDISELRLADQKIVEQIEELRRWQAVMLDREKRVQELKREVNELGRRVGEPARYPSEEAAGGPAAQDALAGPSGRQVADHLSGKAS